MVGDAPSLIVPVAASQTITAAPVAPLGSALVSIVSLAVPGGKSIVTPPTYNRTNRPLSGQPDTVNVLAPPIVDPVRGEIMTGLHAPEIVRLMVGDTPSLIVPVAASQTITAAPVAPLGSALVSIVSLAVPGGKSIVTPPRYNRTNRPLSGQPDTVNVLAPPIVDPVRGEIMTGLHAPAAAVGVGVGSPPAAVGVGVGSPAAAVGVGAGVFLGDGIVVLALEIVRSMVGDTPSLIVPVAAS